MVCLPPAFDREVVLGNYPFAIRLHKIPSQTDQESQASQIHDKRKKE